MNGRVFPGKFAGAAEIGHFNVEENGALCGCGNRGCLEATAAGPAIARTYRETLAALAEGRCDDSELVAQWSAYRTGLGKASQGSGKDRETEPTAATIAEEARLGNPVAISVYRKVGKCVGRAASWAANLVNPEKIVIGGGVAGAFDLFYPSLWNALQKGLFKSANKTLTVEKTGLGYEAGLMGATAVAAVPY